MLSRCRGGTFMLRVDDRIPDFHILLPSDSRYCHAGEVLRQGRRGLTRHPVIFQVFAYHDGSIPVTPNWL